MAERTGRVVSAFRPAVKEQLKARLALDGPTGSGKTWTALSMATTLAQGGRIAVVDTERDSARKYAHRFSFDVASFPPPYEVAPMVEMLRSAETDGYAVVVIDSFSHFWIGEGGVLDAVDAAAARAHGNKFAGWMHGTPLQRHLVDSILALDLHVIVTMRSKMEYVLDDKNGKQVPRKVGMQPVQREGVEYEFDVIGDLDLDHRMTITKSRCDTLADIVVQPHREAEAAQTLLAWLNDGEPRAAKEDIDRIAAALLTIESGELRARVQKEIRSTWGASHALLAGSVGEVLDHIDAAKADAAPFDTPKNEDGTDAPSLLEPSGGNGEVPPVGSYKPQDNSSLAGNVENQRVKQNVL